MDNHVLQCVVEFMGDVLLSVFNNVQCLSIVAIVKFPLKNAVLRGEWNGSLKCPSFHVKKTEFCIERWETKDSEVLVVSKFSSLVQCIWSGWWRRACICGTGWMMQCIFWSAKRYVDLFSGVDDLPLSQCRGRSPPQSFCCLATECTRIGASPSYQGTVSWAHPLHVKHICKNKTGPRHDGTHNALEDNEAEEKRRRQGTIHNHMYIHSHRGSATNQAPSEVQHCKNVWKNIRNYDNMMQIKLDKKRERDRREKEQDRETRRTK